ncbi:hypothetical protein Rs2_36221 [Raphanus sativus]|nr:hypothetical protein Rs2_36221 [Raphanus sativus]
MSPPPLKFCVHSWSSLSSGTVLFSGGSRKVRSRFNLTRCYRRTIISSPVHSRSMNLYSSKSSYAVKKALRTDLVHLLRTPPLQYHFLSDPGILMSLVGGAPRMTRRTDPAFRSVLKSRAHRLFPTIATPTDLAATFPICLTIHHCYSGGTSTSTTHTFSQGSISTKIPRLNELKFLLQSHVVLASLKISDGFTGIYSSSLLLYLAFVKNLSVGSPRASLSQFMFVSSSSIEEWISPPCLLSLKGDDFPDLVSSFGFSFLIREDWFSASLYVIISLLSDSVGKATSTNSSLVSNPLSSSHEELSLLFYIVVVYAFNQRGWQILSSYCNRSS